MTKVLHLFMDHNFVDSAKLLFDRYYPGKNLYVVHTDTGHLKMVRDTEDIEVMNLNLPENKEFLYRKSREAGVNKVLLHGMLPWQVDFVRRLKADGVKVYWIFWGYELYETLAYEKGYKVIDEPFNPFRKDAYFKPNFVSKIIRKVMHLYKPTSYMKLMEMVDYFCFWNKRDYELAQKYFHLPMKYRLFAYSANERGAAPEYMFELDDKEHGKILINHQASFFGNHTTIFKRVKALDKDNRLEKIVPLSYGAPSVRVTVLDIGRKMFGPRFHPLTEYMARDKYFDILKEVDVAIFGQRRQEAAANIIQLLKNGVKVFLRNDNNLLQYYREKGYKIFSFEEDLNSIDDLKPLSAADKKYNRENFLAKRLYYDDYMNNVLDD